MESFSKGLGLRVWVWHRLALISNQASRIYLDIDILSEGLKIEPSKHSSSYLSMRGKSFTIPYDRIKNVKIVERKPSLLSGEKPFIELEFIVGEEGGSQTLTFAPCPGITGLLHPSMGIKTEETRKLYDEIMSKLPVK